MRAVVKYKRVCARGPHGLGKTTVMALLVLWFALTRDGEDWKVPCTASAWRQLEKFLWPEIKKWASKIRWNVVGRPPFREGTELLALSLKLRTGEAFAAASDHPNLIEGAHADHLFYVFDEAKAIPAETFDAAEGAFASIGRAKPMAVAFSTPGEPVGRFFDIQSRKQGYRDWWVRYVTLDECIRARRVSVDWAHDRLLQWGETSAMYLNRVRGEFASSDEESVIPLSWVELAIERWKDLAGSDGSLNLASLPPFTCGAVDVAWTGDASTVIGERHGPVVTRLESHSKEDPMQTTGRVAARLRFHQFGYFVVDAIGLGAGVLTRLREQKLRAFAFVASQRSVATDVTGEWGFSNKRSEAWWRMRDLLDPANGHAIALPPNDQMTGDLTAPHYKQMSNAKLQVESKPDIYKRIGRSTDVGDVVVMMFDDDSPVVYEDPEYGTEEYSMDLTYKYA